MTNTRAGRRSVLFSLFSLIAGAVVGGIVGRILFEVCYFSALRSLVGGLQSLSGAGATPLAPLFYAPEHYTVVFVAVGLIVGGLLGTMLGARAARRVQAQSAQGGTEGGSAWPPQPQAVVKEPEPPAV